MENGLFTNLHLIKFFFIMDISLFNFLIGGEIIFNYLLKKVNKSQKSIYTYEIFNCILLNI